MSEKKAYYQKFRKEWLHDSKFQPWLLEVEGEEKKAFCKFCKCFVIAKYNCLKRHKASQKHCKFFPEETPIKLGNSNKSCEVKREINQSYTDDQLLSNETDVKGKKIYLQNFRKNWLTDSLCKEWISEVLGHPTRALCKACNKLIGAKYGTIVSHAKTLLHIRNCEMYIECSKNLQTDVSDTNFKLQQSWIQEIEDDAKRVYCKFCETDILNDPIILQSHSLSERHVLKRLNLQVTKDKQDEKAVKTNEMHKLKQEPCEANKLTSAVKVVSNTVKAKSIKASSKDKVKVCYPQKFRKEWLNNELFSSWIARDPTSKYRALCKFCKCQILARYVCIAKHASTQKHHLNVERVRCCTANPEVNDNFSNNENRNITVHESQPLSDDFDDVSVLCIKSSELRVALFLAEHTHESSVSLCEQISNMSKLIFVDSAIASKMNLDETKYTKLILDYLYNIFLSELKKELSGNIFSLFINESSTVGMKKCLRVSELQRNNTIGYSMLINEYADVSFNRYLGIVIIFYSRLSNRLHSTYLNILEFEKSENFDILDSIKNVLKYFNLSISNMIGIGTERNNLLEEIKLSLQNSDDKEIPNLTLNSFTYDTLREALNIATNELPDYLKFMVSETYLWFNSVDKKVNHKKLFVLMTEGVDLQKKTATNSDLISVLPLIKAICDHWHEFQKLFKNATSSDKSYICKLLQEMYSNEEILVYFLFIRFVLLEMEQFNMSSQFSFTDPTILFQHIYAFVSGLLNKVGSNLNSFQNPFNLKIGQIGSHFYMGDDAENKLRHLLLPQESAQVIRDRCKKFVVSFISEIAKSVPSDMTMLKDINYFSVQNALALNKISLLSLLEFFKVPINDRQAIETQWHNLTFVKWNNSAETLKFWSEVRSYRNNYDENPYYELTEFVWKILLIPFYNADMMGIFDDIEKSQPHTKDELQLKMLNATLLIKYGLALKDRSYDDYPIPDNILIEAIPESDMWVFNNPSSGFDVILPHVPLPVSQSNSVNLKEF